MRIYYTNGAEGNILQKIVPILPPNMDVFSPYPTSASEPTVWRLSLENEGVTSYTMDGFIGILSDGEAERMRNRLNLFRKRFDDDLARRNKILFGK